MRTISAQADTRIVEALIALVDRPCFEAEAAAVLIDALRARYALGKSTPDRREIRRRLKAVEDALGAAIDLMTTERA